MPFFQGGRDVRDDAGVTLSSSSDIGCNDGGNAFVQGFGGKVLLFSLCPALPRRGSGSVAVNRRAVKCRYRSGVPLAGDAFLKLPVNDASHCLYRLGGMDFQS